MGSDLRGAPSDRPFHALTYRIGTTAAGERVTLEPIPGHDAVSLGVAFAAMDPWAAYRSSPDRLSAFFASDEHDCSRGAIRIDGVLAGAIVVRSPWLHGPYLQFLGMLPGHQGAGIGAMALAWMEREAPSSTRNLWLCVSASNTRARAFYECHGYAAVAEIDGLAADHMDEILMRKRLIAGVH